MRIESRVLEEKLVKVTKAELARLSQKIQEDPNLHRMLATPMKEIPQYRYLYTPDTAYLGDWSLFDGIKVMLDIERRPNIYFSKVNDKFTGFIVYEDNGKVIDRIKMASFKDDTTDTNSRLAKDLIEFILGMASKRLLIEWHVNPDNIHAISQYNRHLEQRLLNWSVTKDDDYIKYSVRGYRS